MVAVFFGFWDLGDVDLYLACGGYSCFLTLVYDAAGKGLAGYTGLFFVDIGTLLITCLTIGVPFYFA